GVLGVAPDYTATGGVVLVGSASGLFRSADGGQNFTLINSATACALGAASSIRKINFSPSFATDNAVFMLRGPDPGMLCVSADRGITWNQVTAERTDAFSLSPVYNHAAANGTIQR